MELTVFDSEDLDLGAALSALHRTVGALQSAIARQFGLTTQQIQLLCTVSRDRPSFGELAGLLGCDKTNVTGMVDRLERRGLVVRETDPSDRRISRVVLTNEGEAVRDDIRAEFAKVVAERCGSLPRAQLARLAQAAAAALDGGR